MLDIMRAICEIAFSWLNDPNRLECITLTISVVSQTLKKLKGTQQIEANFASLFFTGFFYLATNLYL